MNAQVVVKVVELAEELGAPFEVALQNLEGALGLWVFVLVDSEFFL